MTGQMNRWYKIYGLNVESELEMEAAVPLERVQSVDTEQGKRDLLIRWAKETDIFPEEHKEDRAYGCINLLDMALIWICQGEEILVKPLEKYDDGKQ